MYTFIIFCKFLGLNFQGVATDKPIVQLGRYIYTGEYKDALGTSVLFQKQKVKEHGKGQ